MSTPEYYNVLGVEPGASEQEIKKAYRSLSLKYHPDRNSDPDAIQKIQSVNEAYETLSDKSKREQYDAQSRGGISGGPFMHSMGGEFGDMDQFFNMMFGGGGGGFQGMPGMPGIRVFHGGNPFGDGNPFQQMQKPAPIIKQVQLTLEQCYTGGSVPIEIERWVQTKHVKIVEKETIYLNIPVGLDENEMVIIQEKGNAMNDMKGDLKISFQITNNTGFRRQGLDLFFKKTISLKEALCGFSFELLHLNGKILHLNNITNRSVIKPNSKKVIPQLGMIRSNSTGTLNIEFEIEFPDAISAETMDKLKELL